MSTPYTAYEFRLPDLLNFLEAAQVIEPGIPEIYALPDVGHFAVLENKIRESPELSSCVNFYDHSEIKLPLSARLIAPIDLLQHLTLTKSVQEPSFDGGLLLLIKGNQDDFDATQKFIFQADWGSQETVRIGVSQVAFPSDLQQTPPPFPCLLKIENLHAYAPIAAWLKDPDKFEVLLPYGPGRGAPGGPSKRATPVRQTLYLEWGYALPFSSILRDHLPDDVLILLRGEKPPLHLLKPEFHSLISVYHDIEMGELQTPIFKPIELSTKEILTSDPFRLQMSLQVHPGKKYHYDHEEYLQKHIVALEYELAQLQREHYPDTLSRSTRLYVYKQSTAYDNRLEDLRYSILRLIRNSKSHLYQYACLRVQEGPLAGQTFHVIAAQENVIPESWLPVFEIPDLEFYLHPLWQQALGNTRLYLPVTENGFLELYPPILPQKYDASPQFVELLGDTKQRDLGRILLWQYDEQVLRLWLPDREFIPLSEAAPYLNFGLQTVPVELWKEYVPKQIKSELTQIREAALQNLESLSNEIHVEINNAWGLQKADIDKLLNNRLTLQQRAEEADRLERQLRVMEKAIALINEGNLAEWFGFVRTVSQAHQKVLVELGKGTSKALQEAEQIAKQLDPAVLPEAKELLDRLSQLKSKIEAGDAKSRQTLAYDLRRFADQLDMGE